MAQFVDARHNDVIAGAAFAFFDSGVGNNFSFRPQPQPAYGIQHISPDPPYSFVNGTPPFVPPNARNNGYFVFAPQHDASPPPFSFTNGTPPFVPGNARNNGYAAFGFAWDPGDYKPWSYTQNSIAKIVNLVPPVGATIITTQEGRISGDAPFTLLRSTLGLPTAGVTSVPAYRASFVKAGGWWDILAEAPFFFAAGFATQPPRGPFGKAYGEPQNSDIAPFTFTNNTPAVPLTLYVPSQAFGLQQPADQAPFSLTIPSLAINQAGPPGNHFAQGIQQPFDAAPYSFTNSLRTITVLKPPAGAFGFYDYPHAAPHVHTRDGVPRVIIFKPTFRAIAEIQNTDYAPFVFTGQPLPPVSQVPVFPASMASRVFARQWDPDPAPFTFVNIQGLAEGVPFNGLLVQQAIYNLVNAGLEVFITYAYSTTIPYGYVISQNPVAGTPLPPFSVVTIVASAGLPPAPGVLNTTVPNVQGITAQAARDALFTAGLSLDRYNWQISAQTAGTVVSQLPIGLSSVPYGTLVRLTLSLGPVVPLQPIISPP